MRNVTESTVTKKCPCSPTALDSSDSFHFNYSLSAKLVDSSWYRVCFWWSPLLTFQTHWGDTKRCRTLIGQREMTLASCRFWATTVVSERWVRKRLFLLTVSHRATRLLGLCELVEPKKENQQKIYKPKVSGFLLTTRWGVVGQDVKTLLECWHVLSGSCPITTTSPFK